MFNNSGEKCVSLANVLFWAGCIVETLAIIIIISILGWCDGNPALLLLLPVCWAINWFSSLILYTIGEIWIMIRRQSYSGGSTDSLSNNSSDRQLRGLDFSEDVSADDDYFQRLIRNGGWKCGKCGRVNASYVTTCACGKPKVSPKKEND